MKSESSLLQNDGVDIAITLVSLLFGHVQRILHGKTTQQVFAKQGLDNAGTISLCCQSMKLPRKMFR